MGGSKFQMNISPDGATVRLKTAPKELFEAEKSGAKSNTVRIIDAYEADQIKRDPPTKIIIQYEQEIFLRTLTNICIAGEVLGKVIVILSWTNGEHYHSIFGEREPCDSCKHTQSLEDRVCSHSGEKITGKVSFPITEPETISSLPHSMPTELGDHNLSPKEPSTDDSFVTVTISTETQKLLHSIAHGRSINSVIRELYQIHLNKHAEEVGPLHD